MKKYKARYSKQRVDHCLYCQSNFRLWHSLTLKLFITEREHFWYLEYHVCNYDNINDCRQWYFCQWKIDIYVVPYCSLIVINCWKRPIVPVWIVTISDRGYKRNNRKWCGCYPAKQYINLSNQIRKKQCIFD